MSRKVLQIGYEPERDRLIWNGWDIHCGQGLGRSGFTDAAFLIGYCYYHLSHSISTILFL